MLNTYFRPSFSATISATRLVPSNNLLTLAYIKLSSPFLIQKGFELGLGFPLNAPLELYLKVHKLGKFHITVLHPIMEIYSSKNCTKSIQDVGMFDIHG